MPALTHKIYQILALQALELTLSTGKNRRRTEGKGTGEGQVGHWDRREEGEAEREPGKWREDYKNGEKGGRENGKMRMGVKEILRHSIF